MKKSHLALRVASTSIGMILGVYIVMQIIGYFRDNAILGLSSFADMPICVTKFLLVSVIPPMLICGGLLYLFARPLEKTLNKLRAGEMINPDTAERTRKRMLGFSRIVYALNGLGFALGFVIFVVADRGPMGLIEPSQLLILLSNLAASCVYAASQSSLANIAFGELRDRLNILEIGDRKRETNHSIRQIFVGVTLAVYVLSFVEFNGQILYGYNDLSFRTLTAIQSGQMTEAEAATSFRETIPKIITSVAARPGYNPEEISLPWETRRNSLVTEAIVFLLHAIFMAAIAAMIHVTMAYEISEQMKAMRSRLKDVLDGEGDLRKRLTLRCMDEYGEQAELINRLLSRFHDMAARITSAAAENRGVAQSIDRVIREAETMSAHAGVAVGKLAEDLETEAESSRELTRALDSFREAARSVGEAIEEQRKFADGTAAAMEEMAANIRSVETMTGRSGTLTGELAKQGEAGSGAVAETGSAIREIESSANGVLQVLRSLMKISEDTNLLAMNAAIEAAHAGKSGAGFAVVADEVRKLATNAAKETNSIKELMAAMNARVRKGVETSGVSGASFSHLAEGILQAASISKEIADAMREQGKGTADVEGAIARVVTATETIRARMDEQDARTRAMEESLNAALDRFSRLAGSSREQVDTVHKLESSFTTVRAEVDRNLAATGTLEKVLSGLKV